MKKGLYKKIPILYAIKQCYQYAPGLSGLQTLFSLLGGILPSLMVYIVSMFVNAALSILSDAPEYHALIFSACMILLYYVFTHVSDVVERYTTNMIQNALLTKYKPVMVEKIASYQYEWLEDRGRNRS